MVVGEADRPARSRRLPGNRDVSAQADEDAVSCRLGRRARGAVCRQGFRGRPEVELDLDRNPGCATFAIELDPPPDTARRGKRVKAAPVPETDEREGVVVACEPKRLAHRRIDSPVGGRRRDQGDFERCEKVVTDRDLLAAGAVQLDELGVVPEAAARTVDGLQLVFEHRARTVERFGTADGDERSRSQRTQRRGGRSRLAQVAPETAAGGDDGGVGDCAGGAGDGAELPFGWSGGGETEGVCTVAVAVDAFVVPRRTTLRE